MSGKQTLRLSDAQLLMLLSVAAGRSYTAHLSGRSAHGGATGTLASLVRRGLVQPAGPANLRVAWELTEAGRRAIE